MIANNLNIDKKAKISASAKIGDGTVIFPFASIGTIPQDLKFKGENSKLEIGKNNKIREYVTINPGTEGGGGLTKIGNNVHIAGGSGVIKDIPDNTKVMGYPAKDLRSFLKDNK